MGIIRSAEKIFDISVPVVVIGAGACGCSAALAANERRAGVLMIERDDSPTGSTSLSGGQIPAAGTKLQKAAGITDTPEDFAEEILEKAKHQTDADIALVHTHIFRSSGSSKPMSLKSWMMGSHNLSMISGHSA